MSKILVLRQPFPMGNYRLQEVLAERLSVNPENEVYCLEQLNGRKYDHEYGEYLASNKFDVVYFEMLDWETFKVIENHFKDALKILCFASGGVLDKHEDILKYKGIWYDKVMTNSLEFVNLFKSVNVECEYFPFYFSVIDDETLIPAKEYNHDVCFLGMGFNRLVDPQYEIERKIFFGNNIQCDYAIYGNGWDQDGRRHPNYLGILPPDDIGKLYYNSTSAAAIIAGGQRSLGMINNRYTEIAMSKCPIISIPYEEVDWKGLDRWISFAESREEFIKHAIGWKEIKEKSEDEYDDFCQQQRKFMKKQDLIFFEKLNNLINI